LSTPFSFRRVARECALRAIYTCELSQVSLDDALELTFDAFHDEEQLDDLTKGVEYPDATLDLVFRFARALAKGAWQHRVGLDRTISAAIPDYDYNRLAAVDRNVMRLALHELHDYPYIPPAVTINEAVEMAKKYSTAESGKFVNGVLGTVLKQTLKANFDPKTAPADPDLGEAERIFRAPKVELEEETIEADSEQGKLVNRFGWTIKQ